MSFQPNPNLVEQARKMVGTNMAPLVDDLTREYASLAQAYKGGTLENAKEALRRLYFRRGGSITDPELTQHAQLIVQGNPPSFGLARGSQSAESTSED